MSHGRVTSVVHKYQEAKKIKKVKNNTLVRGKGYVQGTDSTTCS